MGLSWVLQSQWIVKALWKQIWYNVFSILLLPPRLYNCLYCISLYSNDSATRWSSAKLLSLGLLLDSSKEAVLTLFRMMLKNASALQDCPQKLIARFRARKKSTVLLWASFFFVRRQANLLLNSQVLCQDFIDLYRNKHSQIMSRQILASLECAAVLFWEMPEAAVLLKWTASACSACSSSTVSKTCKHGSFEMFRECANDDFENSRPASRGHRSSALWGA